MTTQAVTLQIPEPLYRELKQRAVQTNRTIEDETLEVLTAAVPHLPADLEEALSPLTLLDDESLLRAARSHLAADLAAELEELHQKQQREGLTAMEAQTVAIRVRQYERAMLVRAQASALMKARGHDVSTLIGAP